MDFNRLLLKAELKLDEGVRAHPYVDTVGKMTIGVGRNLTDNGLSPVEIEMLLDADINQAALDVQAILPEWENLSDARQRVLLNMAFNLGRKRLAGFMGMLDAIRAGDFEAAGEEMMDSLWAKQVGARGQRLRFMMREG